MTLQNPIPSLRSASSPYGVITGFSYVQSTLGGNNLPVLGYENSVLQYFRIYNNWNAAGSVATMQNISLTVYDDVGANSHTWAKSPVSQSWVRIYETGFGESAAAPALYTRFTDTDTAIGRAGLDSYVPTLGSDGTVNPYIRAGTNTNGTGFIEFATYIQAPDTVGFSTYGFAIAVVYDWTN